MYPHPPSRHAVIPKAERNFIFILGLLKTPTHSQIFPHKNLHLFWSHNLSTMTCHVLYVSNFINIETDDTESSENPILNTVIIILEIYIYAPYVYIWGGGACTHRYIHIHYISNGKGLVLKNMLFKTNALGSRLIGGTFIIAETS